MARPFSKHIQCRALREASLRWWRATWAQNKDLVIWGMWSHWGEIMKSPNFHLGRNFVSPVFFNLPSTSACRTFEEYMVVGRKTVVIHVSYLWTHTTWDLCGKHLCQPWWRSSPTHLYASAIRICWHVPDVFQCTLRQCDYKLYKYSFQALCWGIRTDAKFLVRLEDAMHDNDSWRSLQDSIVLNCLRIESPQFIWFSFHAFSIV